MLGNDVLTQLLERPADPLVADLADVPVVAFGRTFARGTRRDPSTRSSSRNPRAVAKLAAEHLENVERNLRLHPRIADLADVLQTKPRSRTAAAARS
jgi:hypothetical protein